MGSSLGGYIAALYAARHREVEKLVLLAPAFQFPTRWRARYSEQELERWKGLGAIPFFHYGHKEERRLGFQIVADAAQYEDEPAFVQPALVLHGLGDEVVPAGLSKGFAARHTNVRLHLVDSGHELTDVLGELWSETAGFLEIPKTIEPGYMIDSR
jgi:pimeloyl-ACP methyl ester carboxylesterase